MYLIFLAINIYLVNSFNLTDTTLKIKQLLINSNKNRYPRCLKSEKIDSFLSKSIGFFERTDRFGEFLKFSNLSDCESGASNAYVENHVLHGLLIHDLPEIHWQEFKNIHNKSYSTARQEMAALNVWKENLKKVAKHNKEYLAGKKSYSLHLNHFADLISLAGESLILCHFFDLQSVTDYFKNLLKHIPTVRLFDPFENHHTSTLRKTSKQKTPRQVDWRKRGYTPKREEQWKCGACYAFAVTHALQAQLYKKHKSWKELSPQQIVDCSMKDGNMGCNGGSLRAALSYVAREGLATEADYPYVGQQGRCKISPPVRRVKPHRWAMLPPGDEHAIERAVATVGPLPVAVNAIPFTFQLYRSGIYDDPFCTGWMLNHAMLLVGYTQKYWILLNWWGTDWGEDGYIRIRRGFNVCGVANMAAYIEL